jgi:hypothetical protein
LSKEQFDKKYNSLRKIDLKNHCSAPPSAFSKEGTNLHCSLCKHAIHDLTNSDKDEISQLVKSNDKLCVELFLDQLEEEKPKLKKRYLLFALTGLAFTNYEASSNSFKKIEIPINSSSGFLQNLNLRENEEQEVEGNFTFSPKNDTIKSKKQIKFKQIGNTNLYWTNKFPFIKRRIIFRGKF